MVQLDIHSSVGKFNNNLAVFEKYMYIVYQVSHLSCCSRLEKITAETAVHIHDSVVMIVSVQ